MKNKLVFGVGVYEKGRHKASVNGKHTKAYHAWRNMLERCYSASLHELRPTYMGCSVCDEWLKFQSFAEWYYDNYPQDGKSYHLDKDLKILGNKIYSPETCLFVPKIVNGFTTDCGAARGEFMIGVCWNKRNENLVAQCKNPFTRKKEFLGYFANELQAHNAWRARKSELAYQLAMVQDNQEVADALLQWKLALDNNIIHAY